ncbi:MAG TPA: twin-arginine translocation signal domain-containing protein, partial [Planctomycetaceae bacterium]|nr:twin-arginine translocation signal domain-containing protein [Planctomycetaceae bacterium]
MNDQEKRHGLQTSRRGFFRASAAGAAGAGLVFNQPIARSAHASGDETLKVGLVGCGGRGRGAAVQALMADTN